MISVIMTTYFTPDVPQREQYAEEAVTSLVKNLSCDEPLSLHIADDSENTPPTCGHLIALAEEWSGRPVITCSEHTGIGASLNLALSQIDDVWMYTTDDWVLTHPLNLNGPLRLLRTHGYDLVRLGPIHPDLQCVTRFDQTTGWWLDLLQHYGGFAFATRPFLASKRFYEKIGPFAEWKNSYETERIYAEKVAKSSCRLAYWGAVDLAGPWYHAGIENVGYREV